LALRTAAVADRTQIF